MAQNGRPPSAARDTDARENNVQGVDTYLETLALALPVLSCSERSSGSHPIDSNPSISSSFSIPADPLPRPPTQWQQSITNVAREAQIPPNSRSQDVVGRTTRASVDTNDVAQEIQLMRPVTPSLHDIPGTEEPVRSRLLQVMPQLGIGQFLQEFTNQISPWRGVFATGRQDADRDMDETGRLLPSEQVHGEQGRGAVSHIVGQASTETLVDSMSSSGDSERRDQVPHPVTGHETESTATLPSSARVENSTRGRRDSEESDDQTAMDELQALFRRCHNSMPFVALFVIYFAYQHATGILVFVVGTAAVMGLDQRMRAQIALKDKASTWHLLSIVTMCAIDMVAICSVEGEPNPLHHFSQILQSKTNHGSDSESELLSTGGIFWQVLWTVIVNDFLIRLWSVVAKALVAGAKSDRFQCERKVRDEAAINADEHLPPVIVTADEETDSTPTVAPLNTQQAVSTVAFYRRKRKLYGIIEMCSIFLRSLLASIPWCSFYQLCASKFTADVFTFAYLFIKGVILANQGRRIFKLACSFVTLGLEFGVYVSHDELVEAGSPDCSICYESMRQPVKLACSHMFCEECVTEWFDHERSCPLCRASVESSGPTDAENMKPQFLDGRTSLVPQLL